MSTLDSLELMPSPQEAELAKVAHRCLMTALDHSNAGRIALVAEDGKVTDAPVLELPAKALRLFAEILRLMAQQQPIVLLPQNHELTTQEAAAILNVSRPFVVKEIEAGRLKCHKVNRHRRIEFDELQRYKAAQRQQTQKALQEISELSQELDMGY